MDLFTPIIDKDKQHPNFRSILERNPQTEIQNLLSWTEGFPDRDNKFIKEFQTTFNSSFWELYLYKVFKEYDFTFNWEHSTPDFHLSGNNIEFIVEATTANKGDDERPNEWDKEESTLTDIFNPEAYEHYLNNTNEANRYSIIRLSNGILSKYRKYIQSYSKLSHVKNKPFVIAIAPFEQPFFYFQCSRTMMALLYDYYVDEEICRKNPEKYKIPPTQFLGYIEKDSGADIPLGIFNDDSMKEVSAIIFSATATWSKLMKHKRSLNFLSVKGLSLMETTNELIEDGLFIFHNPYARKPLDKSVFRKERVCQVYLDNGYESFDEEKVIPILLENGNYLIMEFGTKHMQQRNLF